MSVSNIYLYLMSVSNTVNAVNFTGLIFRILQHKNIHGLNSR